MPKAVATESEFVDAWRRHSGLARAVAQELGVSERQVLERRRRYERRTGDTLVAGSRSPEAIEIQRSWTQRLDLEVESGSVVVFSDAHYMPGTPSRAHRGLLKVIAELKPKAVIANGDILDGGQISRHAPLGWGRGKVTVAQELKAVKERMGDIEEAARKANPRVKLLRTQGNHDARFDIYLQTHASQYEDVPGFSLSEHLPAWTSAISVMVNDGKGVTPTMIKHRWHNGIHATYNNVLRAGCHMVTGHLHRLKEERWGDYRGRRYAVDTGTLSEVDSSSFAYTEDNPVPWGSGFAVLTFHRHRLLPPELAEVLEDGLVFRSRIYKV